MKRIWGLVSLVVFALSFYGCGGDNGPVAATDNPPTAVGGLAAIAADDSTITLTWNTPSDQSKMASVSAYDLRYSTANITEANWASADTVSGEPAPGEAESADTFTVEGLDLGASYYFALKSADDKDQWSALSNVLHASTDSIDNRLIAYYPLVDDSIDVTGKQTPIRLINTPFQEGGIYSNGVYIYDGIPDSCLAETPDLVGFDFESHTISTRFKVNEHDENNWNFVFVAGGSWRWAKVAVHPDSSIALWAGDGYEKSTTKYVPGTWQESRFTYDGTTARLYLDGAQVAEIVTVLDHNDDNNISNTHFGSGRTFKGLLGRLKVYDEVVSP